MYYLFHEGLQLPYLYSVCTSHPNDKFPPYQYFWISNNNFEHDFPNTLKIYNSFIWLFNSLQMFVPSKKKRYTGVIVSKASFKFEWVVLGNHVISYFTYEKFSLWEMN